MPRLSSSRSTAITTKPVDLMPRRPASVGGSPCFPPPRYDGSASHPGRTRGGVERFSRGRVEDWRGSLGPIGQRPVSHPRSSNRTCGATASGFSPTGFTARPTTGHVRAGVRGTAPRALHAIRRRRTGGCRALPFCAVERGMLARALERSDRRYGKLTGASRSRSSSTSHAETYSACLVLPAMERYCRAPADRRPSPLSRCMLFLDGLAPRYLLPFALNQCGPNE